MPKSEAEPTPDGGYLVWSRDPAVGLFAVLPLWLCYESLRLFLTPNERNGAEALLSQVLRPLGPTAFLLLRVLFAVVVVAAAMTISRRRVPWLRVSLVNALEGTVFGLILGPVCEAMVASSSRLLLPPPPGRALVPDLVGSLGAGIFEELVFRLLLMSVLALLLARAALAFGLPKIIGPAGAILLSALLFSLFHHVGPGAEPFSEPVFVFRTWAGLVLGLLFALRGFGVCVWAHAMYDVWFYLRAAGG